MLRLLAHIAIDVLKDLVSEVVNRGGNLPGLLAFRDISWICCGNKVEYLLPHSGRGQGATALTLEKSAR